MVTAGKLTPIAIKNLVPRAKRYTVNDGSGLFLSIYPSGKRVWILNKSVDGKRVTKTLGSYPEVGIKDARDKVASLLDSQKLETHRVSFEEIANDWLAVKKTKIRPRTFGFLQKRVQKYLIARYKNMSWNDIQPYEFITYIKQITGDKKLTASLVCAEMKSIERYAVNTGRVQSAYKLQGISDALDAFTSKHHPSVHPSKLPEVMTQIYRSYPDRQFWFIVLTGFFTLLRSGEYLAIKWKYVDWANKNLVIPEEIMKMKGRGDFIVPMPKQLVSIFQYLKTKTGENEYVFSQGQKRGERNRYYGQGRYEEIFRKVLHLKGILVPHGIRSIGRTWMAENGIDFNVAEQCLAHEQGNAVVRAYNRTSLLELRRDAMQKWADYVNSCIDIAAKSIDPILDAGR